MNSKEIRSELRRIGDYMTGQRRIHHTPDSIILLTPDARLDALIYALEQSRLRARTTLTEEAWDANTLAWEALHNELMYQLREAGNAVTAKCLGLTKET